MKADVMYRRHGTYDEELTDLFGAMFGEGSAFHEENAACRCNAEPVAIQR